MSNRISIVEGDIVSQEVDAIVNAANTSLLGGGGVDGAIHRAAGPKLLEECRTLNGCPTGGAKITRGYKLSARWVIHTVGPIWRGGHNAEDELLATCYSKSLLIAAQRKLKTVAFPSIGTGAYGFPVERASGIALKTIASFLSAEVLPEKVIIVCFSHRDYLIYSLALEELAHAGA
jgi:O-acetyl-ADP-ribose deacetylase (regulator of RNase III)